MGDYLPPLVRFEAGPIVEVVDARGGLALREQLAHRVELRAGIAAGPERAGGGEQAFQLGPGVGRRAQAGRSASPPALAARAPDGLATVCSERLAPPAVQAGGQQPGALDHEKITPAPRRAAVHGRGASASPTAGAARLARAAAPSASPSARPRSPRRGLPRGPWRVDRPCARVVGRLVALIGPAVAAAPAAAGNRASNWRPMAAAVASATLPGTSNSTSSPPMLSTSKGCCQWPSRRCTGRRWSRERGVDGVLRGPRPGAR